MGITMGTTGHPVGYCEMNTTEKVREWLKRQYTWDSYEVLDAAPGTKRKSNWWLTIKHKETGRVMAVLVITSNRAKSQGMFWTKENDETAGPYATDIPARLFSTLTPLDGEELYAREWRERVRIGPARG
jgi:hypothetical protein